ncbi:3'-5' exonuclease [Herbaspirillum aquaticum]|uniref:3'-5' exonuclease n=1 Tax=Herbaspirillum aquaticum TaxID=568783 RepID=UPI0030C6B834
MKYLIIDLEATCSDDGSIASDDMEIIEIGACWATSSGQVLHRFQHFVKPLVNPLLTPFCTSLTGITQTDVDGAPFYSVVAERLKDFVEANRAPGSIWMSWGSYDLKQLIRESSFHNVAHPIALPHENAKKTFAKVQKIGKQVGMTKACELVGRPLIGQHHRGLDDAENIAGLLPWILGHRHTRNGA